MRSYAVECSASPSPAARLRQAIDAVERRLPGAVVARGPRRVARASDPAPHAHIPDLLTPILGEPDGPRSSTPGLHEWFGLDQPSSRADPHAWLPPLTLLASVAARALARMRQSKEWGSDAHVGRVLWIGRRLWPSPTALAAPHLSALLESSVLVDASSVPQRVWASDVALRSRAVSIVIADGSGFAMADTRRLSLSAARSLCLLVRPSADLRQLSAARTRWLVRPSPAPTDSPFFPRSVEWSVDLLRCKGLRPIDEEARALLVRLDLETGHVRLLPQPAGRSAASA